MFGSGVDLSKIRQVVQTGMVKLAQYRAGLLLQLSKINTQADRIQAGCFYGYFDLPVMAMERLAIALILSQPVCCGKTALNRNFKHRMDLLPDYYVKIYYSISDT